MQYTGLHYLRIVSAFMVIMIHVAAQGFSTFSEDWFCIVFYDSLCRCCVPIFIMISGFLLMENDDTLLVFLRKRFMKIALPFIFYSLVYYYVKNFTLDGFLRAFFEGPIEYHLWYLYFLTGCYLMLPFLQKIFNNSTLSEKGAYVGLWFLIGCVYPVCSQYFSLPTEVVDTFKLQFFAGLFVYAYVGGMLKDMPPVSRWVTLPVYLLCCFLILYFTQSYSLQMGKPDHLFPSYMSPFVCVSAVAFFLLLRDITWSNEHVLSLSKCSFGIYLIHILVLQVVQKWTGLTIFLWTPWVMIPLLTSIVFVLSYGCIYFARKIPVLRFVVG